MIMIFAGCGSFSSVANNVSKDSKQALDSIKTKPFSITKNDKNSQEISYENFINEIAKYDIVVIGEQHDSLNQHIAQAKIIESLQQKRHINVVYEMISTEKQGVLNAAKKNKNLPKNKLKNAIEWDKKWDYDMYKYPLEATFYSDAGLFGGNLSRDEINMFFAQNIAPISGKVSNTQSVKERLKELIAKAHDTDINDPKNSEMLDILVEIQQYKDRRMADVLVHVSGSDFAEYLQNNKVIESSSLDKKDSKNNNIESSEVTQDSMLMSNPESVLLAGQYHAFKTLGVPLHIIDFNKNKKVVVVILSTKGDKVAKKEYDYLINFDTK